MSSNKRQPSVKNREYSEIQITAEQIIREALDNQEPNYKAPKMTIHDEEELEHYRLSKRKEFEKSVSGERQNMRKWTRYAFWEEEQGEFIRARSIFERAIEQDYTSPDIWVKYADFELRNNQVNRARNVLERATYLLPMVLKLWFKYVRLEETNYLKKWMEFKPGEYPWLAYIKFEIRVSEINNARKLFPRYINDIQSEKAFLEWITFERRFGLVDDVRKVFQLMSQHEELCENTFYQSFAEFEIAVGEIERARTILRYGIDHVGILAAHQLFKKIC
ncbi:Crooked neck protein [Entamoeba marina]